MKRIINKQFFFILMSVGVIMGSSCKKTYLDVNSDPNRVTDANITAELIFPQAATTVGVRAASTNFNFLNEWMGYFAPNGTFVPQQNIITYNIDFTFGDALFQNYFNVLFDLHQTEVKGLAGGDTAIAGASIILSAKLFQELVDLYGNIPYSQAFNVGTYTTPTYDNAQDIYNSLELRLDTAISYFGHTIPKAFINADVVNGGDGDKWIKFANTLKLRLLIRQSQVSGFSPTADMTKILANGGVLGAGESVSVNPGYVNDVNKQNPYYANYGWDPTGVQVNTSTNMGNYIFNIFTTTDDPRLEQFFYPVGFSGTSFVGNTLGDPSSTLATSANSSYFGPALVGTLDANGDPDGSGAVQNQFIYPSYESMFLWAEAVARGWVPGVTDANPALTAAITESFVWTGVPDATTAAATYITGNPDITHTVPANSAVANDKIVAFQKYIANTGIDPLESYSDLRRLDFLADRSYISNAPGAKKFLPFRLLYPQSEYTTNATNVLKEGTIDPFTSKLFWEP
ncbi:MAG: SusD/RagB family nutrient-binding outer membrane lipoprotein [Ginsengibacter sp.]